MKRVVVLGVAGSVAAYRAADIARALVRRGYEVRACLTRAAQEFVTPALFEALTGQPCLTHAFDEPVRGRMAHIDWARDAGAIVVCPATVNAIARLAHGEADDMISTIITASTATLVVAPAMNPEMFASEANQVNLRTLERRGALIVEPEEGTVACGEFGQGKLASVEAIVSKVEEALFRSTLYSGLRVLVTAGPTHEAIDPVRFIANKSSGRMGYAIARAALQMGAEVCLISGPTNLVPPPGASVHRVISADDMLQECLRQSPGANLLVGAAAVGDFRPEEVYKEKVRRSGTIDLRLVSNPDILASVLEANPSLPVVGFAAETGVPLDSAIAKLREKGLLAIAMNDVSRQDIGFDSEDNELVLIFADGSTTLLGKDSKFNLACRLLEEIRPRISA